MSDIVPSAHLASQQPEIPSDVLASLLSRPSASKPQPTLRVLDALDQGASTVADADSKNAVHLYCPREGCGSMLLRKGDSELTMGAGGMYDSSGPFPKPPSDLTSSSSSTTSSPETASTSPSPTSEPPQAPYWLVSNSPFGFENAGFSRNIPSTITDRLASSASSGMKLKYVTCAECDLGPIGWTVEGGKEAWVGVERVRYGAA